MLPSTFLNLEINEKAFIMAVIDMKVQADKKEMQKGKPKGLRR